MTLISKYLKSHTITKLKSIEDRKFQKVIPSTAKVICAWDKKILSFSKNSEFFKQKIYINDHITDIHVNRLLKVIMVINQTYQKHIKKEKKTYQKHKWHIMWWNLISINSWIEENKNRSCNWTLRDTIVSSSDFPLYVQIKNISHITITFNDFKLVIDTYVNTNKDTTKKTAKNLEEKTRKIHPDNTV